VRDEEEKTNYSISERKIPTLAISVRLGVSQVPWKQRTKFLVVSMYLRPDGYESDYMECMKF
jgi:hypothetical protein